MSNERQVELNRWAGIGFGFSVIGGIDTHIPPMVCALVKNSPALVSGKVFVGDVLCKVNGINVLNLETKQVVDLIRNCKETITLSLKEDRLSKLKARPFLAEDTLIDPPGVSKATIQQQQHQCSQQKDFNRTVGSPKNYEYGTDGKFTQHAAMNSSYSSKSLPQASPYLSQNSPRKISASSSHKISASSSRNYHTQQQQNSSSYQVSVYPNNSRQKQSPVITKALVYDLDNLPRSPREISSYQKQSPRPSYRSIANQNKYSTDEYYTCNFNKNTSAQTSQRIPSQQQQQQQQQQQHYQQANLNIQQQRREGPRSAPYDINNTSSFTFVDGNNTSVEGRRPQSNPDLETNYPKKIPLKSSESYNNDKSYTLNHNPSSYNRSNYSSPNVFEDSDQVYSEGKSLTLKQSSFSVQSLNQSNHFDQNHVLFDEDSLTPLTLQIPSEEQSFNSSTTASPNFDITTNYSSLSESSSSTLHGNEAASPADIASRLFSLNGYQDKDVAPLLGKNTDYSQQTCREYLRFFDFEGLILDDALRVFLQKFSLTGETQERERILIHFSKRYQECNPSSNMSEDAVHTLVCALMLLNTDLHGQGIQNRMSLNDFINNLSGLCDGHDFPKEPLKTLYNSIKSKEILFSRVDAMNSPKSKRKGFSNSLNPFVELTSNSNDTILCEGLIYRKSVMDGGGRRTPAMKRGWRPCYCVLKGLVLFCYKPENIHTSEPYTIGIHHSLAGYAKDYKKRAHVFKLITSYWSVYYIQVKSQDEVRLWMDSLNMSAALLSSPPLPAPVGSSMKFQRPVMPVSRTRLSLNQQITHHDEKVKTIEVDLNDHMQSPPDPQSKFYLDWESKLDYLEFELKRFKAYISVLTVKRLEPMRELVLKNTAAASSSSSAANTLPKPQKSTLAVHQNAHSHSSL